LNVKINLNLQEKAQALESSLLGELEQLERSPDQQRRQSLKSICVKSAAAGYKIITFLQEQKRIFDYYIEA